MYTLSSAAKATSKSKSTISDAINSGRLSASKNESGEWQIDPAELHRVYPPVRSGELDGERKLTQENASSERGQELFAVERDELVQMLRESLEDVRAERDHWRELAMDFKAQLALPSGQQPRRRGFFARLFSNAD